MLHSNIATLVDSFLIPTDKFIVSGVKQHFMRLMLLYNAPFE